MKIPKLQLGLTSEHGAFNGNIAYAEGSTAENPKSMIQFFGLPNNRTAEQLAEIPECAEAWAFARHVVTASNERDALRAQVAALARLANTALIFIDIFAADKIDDEYNRVLINPLQAAIAAAEGGAND